MPEINLITTTTVTISTITTTNLSEWIRSLEKHSPFISTGRIKFLQQKKWKLCSA